MFEKSPLLKSLYLLKTVFVIFVVTKSQRIQSHNALCDQIRLPLISWSVDSIFKPFPRAVTRNLNE